MIKENEIILQFGMDIFQNTYIQNIYRYKQDKLIKATYIYQHFSINRFTLPSKSMVLVPGSFYSQPSLKIHYMIKNHLVSQKS